MVFCSVGIVLNGPFITVWLGVDKYGGMILSMIFATSTFLWIEYNSNINILNSMGRFKMLSIYTLIDAIIRIFIIMIIYLVFVKINLWVIPLVELAGLLTISTLSNLETDKIKVKESLFKSKNIKQFIHFLISFLIAYLISLTPLINVNGWLQFSLLSVIVFIFFFAFNFLPTNRRNILFLIYKNVMNSRLSPQKKLQ